jgi:PAS domain S-box-containing protein
MEARSQILAETEKREAEDTPGIALPLIARLTESPSAYFHFVSEDQRTLWPGHGFVAGIEPDRFPPEGGLDVGKSDLRAECIQQKVPMAQNGDAPPLPGTPECEGPASFLRELAVPVIRNNRVVAVLGVANKPTPYTPADRDGAALLADVVWHVVESKRSEASLRETERKYTGLVEHAPMGVFTTQSAGRILSMNNAMADILGSSGQRNAPEDAPPWTELFVDPARRDRFLQRLREDGRVKNFLFQARSADGRRPWLSINARVAGPDENGGFLIEGFAGDVTDRVETEAALEKRLLALTLPLDDPQGVRFEDLFNPEDIQRLQDEFAAATGVASIITHPDGTPITRPSNFRRLCAEIIRPTEKGAINCRRSDARIGRPNPDGPTIQPCQSGGLCDAGAAISVGGKHIANWLIGQVRDDTQSEAKIREYAREIGADEDAAAEAFHEVPAMSPDRFEEIARVLFTLANQLSASAYQNIQQARFITERKRSESDRIRMERDYQTLFREMLDGFAVHEIILDDAGRPIDYRFLAVNPAFERLTGLSSETIVGRTVLEALPQTEAYWIETYGRVALTGEPILFDNYSEAMDKHFEVTAFRPALGQFACIFSDITDRKRSEIALERLNDQLAVKNAELEQVVYVASHDLRSPLVNIDGYAKELALLLKEMREAVSEAPGGEAALSAAAPFLEGEIPEALHFIGASAKKMDTLLTGLLRLSRSGRAALDIRPQDMNALMTQVVDATEYRIRESEAAVTVGDLPMCLGDAVQLNQVFSNLLDNALKYAAPDRKAQIRISGEVKGSRSVYEVRDNGIGMAPDHLEKIFDIFHRLHPDRGSGEGLGLTIVRRILDRMEGTIAVASTPGVASRFTIDLPAAQTAANPEKGKGE